MPNDALVKCFKVDDEPNVPPEVVAFLSKLSHSQKKLGRLGTYTFAFVSEQSWLLRVLINIPRSTGAKYNLRSMR